MRSMVEGAYGKGHALPYAPSVRAVALPPPRAGEDQWDARNTCRPVPRRTSVASV